MLDADHPGADHLAARASRRRCRAPARTSVGPAGCSSKVGAPADADRALAAVELVQPSQHGPVRTQQPGDQHGEHGEQHGLDQHAGRHRSHHASRVARSKRRQRGDRQVAECGKQQHLPDDGDARKPPAVEQAQTSSRPDGRRRPPTAARQIEIEDDMCRADGAVGGAEAAARRTLPPGRQADRDDSRGRDSSRRAPPARDVPRTRAHRARSPPRPCRRRGPLCAPLAHAAATKRSSPRPAPVSGSSPPRRRRAAPLQPHTTLRRSRGHPHTTTRSAGRIGSFFGHVHPVWLVTGAH